MARLFIAIELPEELKNNLIRLRIPVAGISWLPPGQLHLTLAFLGEVTAVQQQLLVERLGTLRPQDFQLQCTATGCFPDRRRPRVLWMGLRPEPLLEQLVRQIVSAVTACQIPQEERPFSAHITLGRWKHPVSHGVDAFLGRSVPSAPFAVREFVLFDSRLTAAGAIHTPLVTFPLLPPG